MDWKLKVFIGFVVLLLIIVVIALSITGFFFRKDCDCAAEGESCLIVGKPYGIKYMDAKDPNKFTEKTFGIGGDILTYPLTIKCEQANFATDPSPGNAKKCTLTRSKLAIC